MKQKKEPFAEFMDFNKIDDFETKAGRYEEAYPSRVDDEKRPALRSKRAVLGRFKKSARGSSAKRVAFWLLAIKSRSIEELRKKLTLKGFPSQEIEETLIYCQEAGYLNDDHIAKRRVEQLEAKGYGPRYIKMKLKGWGLKNPGFSSEAEVIRSLLQKANWKKKTPQQKAAALARRGFSAQAIYSQIRHLPED